MEAYFTRDKDPHGGVYDVFRVMPDMNYLRNTIQEIRKGDLPAEDWLKIVFAETKPDLTTHYDDIFKASFDAATVVWTREGGFVNGNE